MGNFFNPDSGFSKFMGKIVDLFILNILWIICSIPIVTIGAATTASYSVTLNLINEEEGYIIKNFFKALKENFKKATLIWLIIMLLSVILGFNLIFWLKSGLSLSYLALPLICFSLLVFLLTIPYIFPVLTKTSCSILIIIKYCFFIALRNLPYSILIAVFNISILTATFYIPIMLLIMVVLGISLHSYMVSRIFLVVFNKNIAFFDKMLS